MLLFIPTPAKKGTAELSWLLNNLGSENIPACISLSPSFSAQSPLLLFFAQELQKTDGHTIPWICQRITQNQQSFSGGTILCLTIKMTHPSLLLTYQAALLIRQRDFTRCISFNWTSITLRLPCTCYSMSCREPFQKFKSLLLGGRHMTRKKKIFLGNVIINY